MSANKPLTDEEMLLLESGPAPSGGAAPLTDEEMAALEDSPLSMEPQPSDTDALRATKGLISVGGGVIKDVADVVGDVSDRFLGAPIRAGVDAYVDSAKGIAKGELSYPPYSAAKAAWQQFAEDPTKAPRGEDIAPKLGVSTNKFIPVPAYGNLQDALGQRQMKVSPAQVVGVGIDVATDPLSYAGMGFAKAAKIAETHGIRVAASLTRIPEKEIIRYMENTKRIKSAAEAESRVDIEEGIDTAIKQVTDDRNNLEKLVKEKQANLDQKYNEKRKALIAQTDQYQQARSIGTTLEAEKNTQNVASDLANQALDASDAVFSRDDMLRLVNEAMAIPGEDIIGDSAVAAVKRLRATRGRLMKLPPYLDGQRVRKIIQQIRKDINFDVDNGQWDETLNSMRKHVSEGTSAMLKERVPEYADIMAQMGPASESIGRISNLMGTEKKAAATLETLRKGTSAQVPVIEARVAEFAKATGNRDLLDKLMEYKRNRELAEAMKTTDLRAKLFPDEVADIKDHEAMFTMADNIHAGIKPLGNGNSDTVQSAMRNQGFREPSTKKTNALKNLGDTTGVDYLEKIKDRNAFDAFDKDRTAGSRMAKMGAGLGGGIGGLTGNPKIAGGLAGLFGIGGGIADVRGGKWLRSALDVKAGVSDSKFMNMVMSPVFNNKFGGKLMRYGPAGISAAHKALLMEDREYQRMINDLNAGDNQYAPQHGIAP